MINNSYHIRYRPLLKELEKCENLLRIDLHLRIIYIYMYLVNLLLLHLYMLLLCVYT